jgi:hypothetical protein
MKKFISALSSFVIAATAMGGTLAFTSNAAVNGTVDKTIIAIRSDGKNSVDVKAGATVPVKVYVPQSSGFNGLTMKFAIGKDGKLDDTLGQGSVKDRSEPPTVIQNYKDAFGNYGIQMVPKGDKDSGFSRPGCLCSGKLQGKTKQAGNAGTGTTQFTAETWIVIWKAGSLEMGENTPIDSYGDWVAHGGDVTNKEFDYDNYTRVTTWTKDEPWAYEYSLLEFDLVLPDSIPDGSYTFDIYRDTIVNTHPSSLFDDNNNPVPDDQRNTMKSKVAYDETIFEYDTEPLVINVGEVTPGTTTTQDKPITATAPTTTVEDKTTPSNPGESAGTITYNLVPQGLDYTKSSGKGVNNAVTVEPGQEFKVDWMLDEDPGTAGIQIALDFSQVTLTKSVVGDAYDLVPEFNTDVPDKKGQVVYAWAKNDVQDFDDSESICTFTIKAPETAGKYTIGLDTKEANKVVPKDETKHYDIDFRGLDITVGGPVTTTTEPITTTTTQPTTPEPTTSPTVPTTTSETAPITTTTTQPTTSQQPVDTVLYGDVNCDGDVRINDVVLLNKYLAKNATVSPQGLKNADCEYDEHVNSKDATKIKQFLALIIERSALGKQA